MAVTDPEKLSNFISTWIYNYLSNQGIKTIISTLENTAQSLLLSVLCKKSGIKTICLNFSKVDDFLLLKQFTKEQHIDIYNFYLNMCQKEFSAQLSFIGNVKPEIIAQTLQAIVIINIAKIHSGIVLSSLNRNQIKFTRTYKKYESIDILPLGDLFESEINELFNFFFPSNSLLLTSYPLRDFTHQDVEWADRENEKSSILSLSTDPTQHPSWHNFTAKQKQILAKLHQIEKLTKHKEITQPICTLRHLEGFVR